jgi:hypothetical protein
MTPSLLIVVKMVSILRTKFLYDQEKTWQLKSKALWLAAGDQKTKYFQNFANHWRSHNTIWELIDSSANKV